MNICTPGRSFTSRLLIVGVAALTLAGGARGAAAQTQYIPYFGKNQIRYDTFKWQIYTTDHFEIYYYPEIEPQLEKIASYAESAYQHVSSELKHDLAFKVPLILFSTSSEFWQQNVTPGAAQEGDGVVEIFDQAQAGGGIGLDIGQRRGIEIADRGAAIAHDDVDGPVIGAGFEKALQGHRAAAEVGDAWLAGEHAGRFGGAGAPGIVAGVIEHLP